MKTKELDKVKLEKQRLQNLSPAQPVSRPKSSQRIETQVQAPPPMKFHQSKSVAGFGSTAAKKPPGYQPIENRVQAIGQIQQRTLTLKQLKDTIQDMYSQKIKFDKKCEDSRMARETMEQYMYTYLNQKYGLKTLIIEWATALINGIQLHYNEDHEVTLFGKILKNECDEEFRFIQMHVKDTLNNLLKVLLKDKYPFKGENDINKMLDLIQQGIIEEWMWRRIIEKMYDPQDSQVLEERFLQQIEYRENNYSTNTSNLYGYHTGSKQITDAQIQKFMVQNQINQKKMSREEIMSIMRKQNQGKLLFIDF